MAVAVFKSGPVIGEAVATDGEGGIHLAVHFTKLPGGKHGFHIHTAGDLRGEGCKGACSHWSKDKSAAHGDYGKGHTGDLGNIAPGRNGEFKRTYIIKDASVDELFGRTLIVHADPDDLGEGGHDDSKTTGHSGARIACAIFGRAQGCEQKGGVRESINNNTLGLGLLLGVVGTGIGYYALKNNKRRK